MSNETEAPELIRAIEAIPTRTEMISGQAFRYVKLSEVLDLLDTRADLSDAKDKRIEELERTGQEYIDALKARIAELEAKLDRVLREYYDVDLADAEPQSLTDAILDARATLATITAQTTDNGEAHGHD